ncbi:MAG: tRNA uridine-5-carboxymethylaminomethyl(34) synthesis GTPase MnmE [Candidatus Cloacimonetes bacterium]|nr:tRNA uridine-5-carboxymethylaminomethyl(34) synthesis GTPase MnmE [Candidatus Cloacimonadota bacterium]
MTNHNDTITAIATPPGKGGIAVIRISGPESLAIIKQIFKPSTPVKEYRPNITYLGKVFDENELIDQVIVIYYKAPHSYTGEDVIEISCHGGKFLTRTILELVLSRASRLARKGEFTKRAFLNGKLDLTEAESVVDLIDAKTRKSQKVAIERLEGKLYEGIEGIIKEINELRTEIELDIDFPEHSNQKTNHKNIVNKIQFIKNEITRLIATADEGIILNEGYRIAIAGEPNAGKSSIFNRLIENERSIVTDIPGTTRDFIEEDISLEGYWIKLFDTAGLRESTSEIEISGIKKSYDIVKNAHLVLWIEDTSVHKEIIIPERIKNKDYFIILNKLDLLKSPPSIDKNCEHIVAVSAKTGHNIDVLKDMIIDKIDLEEYDISQGILSNARQLSSAKKCRRSLLKALKSAKGESGYEFIAFDLREASEYLEEIIGKITSEDIINNIFDRFCVGK